MRESLRKLTADDRMSPRRAVGTRRTRVELLDGGFVDIDVERKAKGSVLLDQVCEYLGIYERDFFGLLHAERGDPRVWVDINRRLSKTFKNEPWEVRFAVKFYPQEPTELQDDITREQIMFAVRRDVMEGRLPCTSTTLALLTSYSIQAELGDAEETLSSEELRLRLNNMYTEEIDDDINQLYDMHKGQSPSEAVINFLENAKKLPLFGAELHCVLDSHDVDLIIGVGSTGISVYRDGLLMNRFPWPKIIKISYNKKVYTLKLRPSEFDEFETSLSFRLNSSRACKKLWKCSVEHHMFFRRAEPVSMYRLPLFPALGSRRLSCRRTLRQLRDAYERPAGITA